MKNATFTIGRSRRHEHGVTLLMVAISIAVLLAIAALAIDLGVLYTARTSAQHAVDAAALAGAFTFANTPSLPQPATAADSIKTVLKANSVLGKQVNMDSLAVLDNPGTGCPASAGTPPFICVDKTNQRVTVSAGNITATSVELYFAKIMGLSSIGVGATATAEAGKSATGTYCLKPLFFPSSGSWDTCTNANALFDSSTGQLKSSYVGQQIGMWVKKADLLPPSQYGLLAITENPGGAGVREGFDGLSSCADTLYKCGDRLILDKPGGTDGPVKQGGQALIGTPNNDSWQSVGHYCYQGNCNDVRDTSRSLVTIAIWDCSQSVKNGRGDVAIAGFAQVFIDNVANHPTDTGGITAHLVSASSCSGSGSGGTGSSAAVPVRLIQTPQ